MKCILNVKLLMQPKNFNGKYEFEKLALRAEQQAKRWTDDVCICVVWKLENIFGVEFSLDMKHFEAETSESVWQNELFPVTSSSRLTVYRVGRSVFTDFGHRRKESSFMARDKRMQPISNGIARPWSATEWLVGWMLSRWVERERA